MPAPSAALTTLRPELGTFMEFDLAMDRQGFIGTKILPMVTVAKQSGTFGKIPIEQLIKTRNTARAPGSGYSRGNFTFTQDTFTTYEHGAEEVVDDNEAALYSDYFVAEQIAVQRAVDAILRNQEIRIAAAVGNTTTWTGATLTTSIGTPWATVATATPVDDVEAAVRLVRDNSGMLPNAMIISWLTYRNLRLSDQILDRVQTQNFQDVRAGMIGRSHLSAVFDIPNIIVAGAIKDSDAEGDAFDAASIWNDDYCMICRIAETGDIREPCIGRTFHWGEDGSSPLGTIETYREEAVRGDVVRVRHQVGEEIIYPEMGHLLTGCLT